MSIYIIAQFIGFVGYLFYISAPYFKTKARIIQMDVIAFTILCIQWYLLGQNSLLVLSLLVLLTSLCVLIFQKHTSKGKYLFLLYPVGYLSIVLVSTGSIIDILVMVALYFVIASKLSPAILTFRVYAVIGGAILVVSSVLALSIPAVIFNALFVGAHIFKLYQKYYLPRPQLLVKSCC